MVLPSQVHDVLATSLLFMLGQYNKALIGTPYRPVRLSMKVSSSEASSPDLQYRLLLNEESRVIVEVAYEVTLYNLHLKVVGYVSSHSNCKEAFALKVWQKRHDDEDRYSAALLVYRRTAAGDVHDRMAISCGTAPLTPRMMSEVHSLLGPREDAFFPSVDAYQTAHGALHISSNALLGDTPAGNFLADPPGGYAFSFNLC